MKGRSIHGLSSVGEIRTQAHAYLRTNNGPVRTTSNVQKCTVNYNVARRNSFGGRGAAVELSERGRLLGWVAKTIPPRLS
jgi:hypothetical protein